MEALRPDGICVSATSAAVVRYCCCLLCCTDVPNTVMVTLVYTDSELGVDRNGL